ncbi:MAG: hypothetical protein J7K72_01135 [Candidatus Aenigmarchaeota archaeon]|nr:hypothetical protein [Candidatus Aenigmarchaeota archaeon]
MKVKIKKPLYRTRDGIIVGIYDKRVKNAIIKREPLTISCGGIKQTFDPNWIAKNCPVIKKTFLIPEKPMRLYKVLIRFPNNEIEKLAQMGIFG